MNARFPSKWVKCAPLWRLQPLQEIFALLQLGLKLTNHSTKNTHSIFYSVLLPAGQFCELWWVTVAECSGRSQAGAATDTGRGARGKLSRCHWGDGTTDLESRPHIRLGRSCRGQSLLRSPQEHTSTPLLSNMQIYAVSSGVRGPERPASAT